MFEKKYNNTFIRIDSTKLDVFSEDDRSFLQSMPKDFAWRMALDILHELSGELMREHSPFNGSTGVDVDQAYQISFNQEMDDSTMVFTLKKKDGTPVSGSGIWNGTKDIYTFTPTNNLAEETEYVATFSVSSDAGKSILDTSSFTTGFSSSS